MCLFVGAEEAARARGFGSPACSSGGRKVASRVIKPSWYQSPRYYTCFTAVVRTFSLMHRL